MTSWLNFVAITKHVKIERQTELESAGASLGPRINGHFLQIENYNHEADINIHTSTATYCNWALAVQTSTICNWNLQGATHSCGIGLGLFSD